jgi:hypothetical protein
MYNYLFISENNWYCKLIKNAIINKEEGIRPTCSKEETGTTVERENVLEKPNFGREI